MSMYVRVKRKRATIFLHVEPTDTVLEVKQKLQDLVEQPPEKTQLFKGTQLLEDAKKLAEAKGENDDVLGMVYQLEDGTFEAVDITAYEAS